MLHFFLRISPESDPLPLDDYILEGSSLNSIEISAEDQLNNFRGSQITLTLDDISHLFSSGTYKLQGGEEIFLISPPASAGGAQGGVKLWAGTVDPAYIERDHDSTDLKIRVLQHGSTLNSVFAGMPDWTGFYPEETLAEPQQLFRYKGKTDNWERVEVGDRFDHNEIADEDTEVFYTPSAFAALTDLIERAKFTKSWLYHSDTLTPFGIQTYPAFERDGRVVWTGQFKQHYHPDFDNTPADRWPWTDNLVETGGAFLRNQNPVRTFHARNVADILTDLVNQFNRTARFPLSFDPATDCILSPPQLNQAIELLARNSDVESFDLYAPPWTSPKNSLLVLINHTSDLPEESLPRRISLYRITEDFEVIPFFEHHTIQLQSFRGFQAGAPAFSGISPGGFRFARTSFSPSQISAIQIYAARYALVGGPDDADYGGDPRIRIHATRISIPRLLETTSEFPFHYEAAYSELVPLEQQGQRAVAFLTNGNPSGLADHREGDPIDTLALAGAQFRAQNGGLIVSEAQLARFAFDYENAKLSQIISDLAKATFSTWSVTADGRLKFISRLVPTTQHFQIPATSTLQPAKTFIRGYDQQDIPNIGSGLKLADPVRLGLENWYRDQVVESSSPGIELTIPLEDFESFPQINDTLSCDVPQIAAILSSAKNPDLIGKYENRFYIEKILLDPENETLRITAVIPPT